MSGLSSRADGRSVFLEIVKGKVRMRVNQPTATSIKHTIAKGVNAGKTVDVEEYDQILGRLVKVEAKDGQFGKNWLFTIIADGVKYLLQTPYSSATSQQLLKRLVNCNLEKDLSITGYYLPNDKKPGEFKTVMVIYQDGKKIDLAYTREAPNGLPELKKVKVKGVEQWDDTEQLEFFENLCKQLFKDVAPEPASAVSQAYENAGTEEIIPAHPNGSADDDEDLPF